MGGVEGTVGSGGERHFYYAGWSIVGSREERRRRVLVLHDLFDAGHNFRVLGRELLPNAKFSSGAGCNDIIPRKIVMLAPAAATAGSALPRCRDET